MFRALLLFVVLTASAILSPSASAADVSAMPCETRATPVSAGVTPPDFTLEDQDGRKHSLAAQRGRPFT